MINLTLAEQDPDSPPARAGTLSALGAQPQAILDSVRQIACGISTPVLADCGVAEALRAQAVRASVDTSLAGIAPRSTQPAETALYFSCLEAIPNLARDAGRTTHARLGIHHEHDVLTVRLEDDGRGVDPKHTPDGAGRRNIDERIQALGGTVELTFARGLGIVLTTSLPWRRTAEAGMTQPCPQPTAIRVRDPQPHNGNLTTHRDDRRQ